MWLTTKLYLQIVSELDKVVFDQLIRKFNSRLYVACINDLELIKFAINDEFWKNINVVH